MLTKRFSQLESRPREETHFMVKHWCWYTCSPTGRSHTRVTHHLSVGTVTKHRAWAENGVSGCLTAAIVVSGFLSLLAVPVARGAYMYKQCSKNNQNGNLKCRPYVWHSRHIFQPCLVLESSKVTREFSYIIGGSKVAIDHHCLFQSVQLNGWRAGHARVWRWPEWTESVSICFSQNY